MTSAVESVTVAVRDLLFARLRLAQFEGTRANRPAGSFDDPGVVPAGATTLLVERDA